LNPLLIFTTVNGRYRVYADLFKFCCKRAYPDYEVIVMDLPDNKIPHYSSCFRFLVDPQWDGDVYITDIDMMICPEKVRIEAFHKAEIEQTGYCYSNSPRWKEPHGENRLTGLHYVTKEWWDRTLLMRSFELNALQDGKLGHCKCDDEMMLMRIVKNSGLPVTKQSQLTSRHHGIHLGTVRDYAKETIQSRKSALKERIDRFRANYWLKLIETQEYRSIFATIQKQDKQATWELQELERFCRGRAK